MLTGACKVFYPSAFVILAPLSLSLYAYVLMPQIQGHVRSRLSSSLPTPLRALHVYRKNIVEFAQQGCGRFSVLLIFLSTAVRGLTQSNIAFFGSRHLETGSCTLFVVGAITLTLPFCANRVAKKNDRTPPRSALIALSDTLRYGEKTPSPLVFFSASTSVGC